MKELVILSALLAVLLPAPSIAADRTKVRPVSADIVWGHDRVADDHLPGDVRVTLSGGHRERWTRHGGCALVQVSKKGVVGWTHGTGLHPTQGLMNSTLVVAREGKLLARIKASRPFIRSWEFADQDSCVILLCAGPHGPGTLEKYRIRTRVLVDECFESTPFDEKPPWAQAFVTEEYRRDYPDEIVSPHRLY